MNELTAKLQELHSRYKELENLSKAINLVSQEINTLKFDIAANMGESVAYPIDGAIAIRHDCESNDIDFYPIAKPMEDLDDTPIDEIKDGLRRALTQAKNGERIPLDQMWEGIEPNLLD